MAARATPQMAGLSFGMARIDVTLPSQHFGPRRQQAPEQGLMIAVLADALECVENDRRAADTCGQRLYLEAEEWFLAEETTWPYSFECICSILDLDADVVRKQLRMIPHDPASPATRRGPF